ncbi:N-acetylmuramoyl-L-alanine amidase family protein [Sediminibacterium soli]|uniref:N-acetylmuramoyl-L-alanine amidase family protein n=1 Tax=Sediminibacterium soli TaxID=2698829 RepID=UPI001379C967|nr:N-acetylmuramoyl-L-alanine amidase [Sediminibacterium soli]NCI46456.1 N-acetylmuramoyl-L-alanine amidase [Sediminibacterium soli]
MLIRKYAALILLSFGSMAFSAFVPVINHGSDPKKPFQKQPLKRIVIDAGHGGGDIGAKGRYSTEKEISLSVALRLERMLKADMPDVDIVMTRRTDVFDPVTRKAQLANQAKGDLFICIHVNAGGGPVRHREFVGYRTETYYKGKGRKKKAYTRQVKEYRTWTTPNPAKGTETFIYGVDKSEAAKAALSANEDLYLDSISARELKDFNPTDPAKMMIINMKTQSYFARSANLALTIEEEFKKIGRISREAKQRQKGIWVLQAVAMPAVLVETGFISNPDEEDYLNSAEGQQEICEVITRSVKRYRFSLEKQVSGNGAAGSR